VGRLVLDDHGVVMTRPTWIAVRCSRRRGESGFALIAGLMIWILLCGVTLVALLSMTISGSKVAVQQAVDSRQVRAADSALEAAINRIRMDPAGAIGQVDSSGNCATGLGPSGSDLDYADGSGTDVTVSGECERSPQRIPDPDPGEHVTAQVDVVGGSYKSSAALPDTVDWKTDCTTTASTDCYPWKLGIGAPNYAANSATIASQTPTVVHTSDPTVPPTSATLQVAGDLNVKQSAIPLTNPPASADAVGMTVAGRYRQGGNGLFKDVGGVNNCGILGPSSPWSVNGSRIIDSDDTPGAPECGGTVTTKDTGLAAPGAAPTTTGSVPACSGGAGTVLTFSPGRYGKAQTSAINDLLGGSCPNHVFWFQPGATGQYWFDVDDGSNDAAERNSLVIDDATARVIFGALKTSTGGNAANAVFPNACDPAADGVSITLSPRTSLRHKQGRVAICDRSATTGPNSAPPPAIYQSPVGDGGWSGAPDPGQSTLSRSFDDSWLPIGSSSQSNDAASWVTDGSSGTVSFSCTIIFTGTCAGDVNLSARGIGSSTVAPAPEIASSPARSLDMLVKANSSGNDWNLSLVSGGKTSAELTFYRSGSSTPTCAVGFPGVPDSKSGTPNTLDYDLFSGVADPVGSLPTCKSVQAGTNPITRGDLRNSRVDVRFRILKDVTFGFAGWNTVMSIDGIELRAGWDLTPTGGTGGTGWSNAQNITALDGQHTGYTLHCGALTGNCPTDTRSMTATGLDSAAGLPTGTLQKAGVVVTGETTSSSFLVNGSFLDLSGDPDVSDNSWMRATVNLAGGGQCVATWNRVPFWGQGVYLDLLNAPGNCGSTLTSASQLVGANATLDVFVQRNSGTSLSSADYGIRIDHLKISTVSSGDYAGPPAPNLFTESSSTGTSFNVFGPVSTPLNALNIQWKGVPPKTGTTDVPVIGGQTVIAALGSFVGSGGQAGVLCCAPTKAAERIVVLHANVLQADGSIEERGTVRVRVRDAGGNGSSVSVEDWRLK
jgi:hypothetical protein